jgi:flagellar FliJ protein
MAKGFNFSLQKVLDVRKHTENQRSIELSRAQQEFRKEQERLQSLNENKTKVLNTDHFETTSTVEISLNSLKVTNNYIDQLNRDITRQQDQVSQTGQKVDDNRDKLLSAVKDKKVVELLKDRYSEKFRKMKNLEASKNESEIALRIAMKNKGDK